MNKLQKMKNTLETIEKKCNTHFNAGEWKKVNECQSKCNEIVEDAISYAIKNNIKIPLGLPHYVRQGASFAKGNANWFEDQPQFESDSESDSENESDVEESTQIRQEAPPNIDDTPLDVLYLKLGQAHMEVNRLEMEIMRRLN